MTKKTQTKVGEFLHAFRAERHETLRTVAKRLGYSVNLIWQIEKGKKGATQQFIKKLITEYELDKEHLVNLYTALFGDFLTGML